MIESIKSARYEAELLYEKMPHSVKGAIIICAGGGYHWLSPREEWPVAHVFAAAGYQTYILKYSVGAENAPLCKQPMEQLAWAVRTIKETGIPFVAVCGFSAGGHVCSTLGVHWNDEEIFPSKEMQMLSRPDAMILGYSATQVKAISDEQFRNILYGSDEKIQEYLETVNFITDQTPPTFLWHTVSDETVPVHLSIEFAEKLIEAGVMTELHLFPKGSHGLSVATPNVDDPENGRYADKHVAEWISLCENWLDSVNRM